MNFAHNVLKDSTSSAFAANILLVVLQSTALASPTLPANFQQPAPIRTTSRLSGNSWEVDVPTMAFAYGDLDEFVRPTTAYEKVAGELRQWKLLHGDWDGEGAAAPNAKSIEEAVTFVTLLGEWAEIPEPMLLASGHAALYWNENNRYADIEFLGDGRIAYFIRRDGDKHKGVLAFNAKRMPSVLSALLGA